MSHSNPNYYNTEPPSSTTDWSQQQQSGTGQQHDYNYQNYYNYGAQQSGTNAPSSSSSSSSKNPSSASDAYNPFDPQTQESASYPPTKSYDQSGYQPYANQEHGSYGQDRPHDRGERGHEHDNRGDRERGDRDRGDRDRGDRDSYGRGSDRGGRGRGRGGFQGNRGPPRGPPEERPVDTVYITGLGPQVKESELAAHFGSIGVIRLDKKTREQKIQIYKDRETGMPKGDAVITYEDPMAAEAAIQWFNGKEFQGSIIQVELAQRKAFNPADFPSRGRGRGGDRGRGRGRGGGPGGQSPDGDEWCGNNNWARRSSCNKCQAPKPGVDPEQAQADQGMGRGRPAPPNMSEGDWACPSCENVNWARRIACNKCGTPNPNPTTTFDSGRGRGRGGRGRGGDFRGGRDDFRGGRDEFRGGRDDRRDDDRHSSGHDYDDRRDDRRDDRGRDDRSDRHSSRDDYDDRRGSDDRRGRDGGRERISDDRRDRRDRSGPY